MNFQKEKDTANPFHIGERIEHPFDHKAPAEEPAKKKFNFRDWESDHMVGDGFLPKRSRR
jgi:hypothetical protein